MRPIDRRNAGTRFNDDSSLDDQPLAAYKQAVEAKYSVGRQPAGSGAAAYAADWEAQPYSVPAPEPHATPAGHESDLSLPEEAGTRTVHVAVPPETDASARWVAMLGGLVRLAGPRLRDRRLLAGGAVAVAVVIVGVLLLGGGQGGQAVSPSPTPASGVAGQPSAPTGSATLTLTGGVVESFTFAGPIGSWSTAGPINATWSDVMSQGLTLSGPVGQGTRATNAALQLSWTVTVNGLPVTFTSKAGECSVGMGVGPGRLSGSFVCTKVKSPDGTLVVNATGKYTT